MFYSCAYNKSIEYPSDYNKLPKNFKIKTLSHLLNLSEAYFYAEKQAYASNLPKSIKRTYMKLANEYMNKINGIVQYLKHLGIYVAYDWTGHRKEWFFVTEDEADRYDDWLHQLED